MNFPVDDIIPDLKAALNSRPSAILVAEPGAGKTTRVPLALMDEPWVQGRRIVMLEPRRLAARAAATRMAQTLGEEVGGRVGYSVRMERKVSKATQIEVVTEGLLTRRLQADAELSNTALVIFDEFHERSLDGDLALALCLDVQRSLRPDLKILVMSATLDVETLRVQLGDAPEINAKGRMFPVETRYLDKATRQTIVADATKATLRAARDAKGSILLFLPGEGEIRRVATELEKAVLPNTHIRPLYGAMPLADQDAAIKPSPSGTRKIVLATTIAETSLTIDGIEAVVDTGLKRSPRFDPASGMTGLETIRVSQASAEQRKGRAGRLGPGICYRLWPEEEMRALKEHDDPEIRIADLSGLVLELAAWGVSARDGLPWIELPPAGAFAQAQELLRELAALDHDNRITAHGKDMARLPLHPRLSHMVIAGKKLGAGAKAAEMAALLSERDGLPRDAPLDAEQRLLFVRGPARDRMRQSMKQIMSLASLNDDKADVGAGVLLALAYPDRIAQRRGGHGRFRMASGAGAQVADHDALAKKDFIAIALLDGGGADARVQMACEISEAEIEKHFGDLIETKANVFWDTKANAVSAAQVKKLGALVLQEKPISDVPPEQIASAMLQGIAQMGPNALPWSDAAQMFRARINFLKRMMPEAGFPDFSDEALKASLEEWLLPYLSGMSRKSHLERLDMLAILRSMVPHELLLRVEKLAPTRMEVPGGGHYQIDYTVEGDPTLRVRLQEMFGMQSAPQIADGRAKLKIELLSPAGRPVAVTQSLETFWVNAYADVRKDLRGRYPKHFWPEDPLTAQAVAPRRLR
ncbi:ATP-dependent helicase HrpB [Aestuariivirga litoralis]|uniref:ATP-dependent helicase HrpB n=1 Tax=Aestuariivirga litoralis TaxID=2650924 RepID=UPI0018C79B3C|nr:ATP-dependent helicase HrpB [Aestuariivirga litoralis]MBG1232898.1 ATP-dependent helicase HrpB [Aestuariivirga litoralis]